MYYGSVNTIVTTALQSNSTTVTLYTSLCIFGTDIQH